MSKLQQKAVVELVEITEALAESNKERTDESGVFTENARLVFNIAGNAEISDEDDVTALVQERMQNTRYSVLFNIVGFDKTNKDNLGVAKKMLEGKTLTVSVFKWTVEELTEGKYNAVYSESGRAYSSLSDPHVGVFDDSEASFAKVYARLQRNIEEGRLSFEPFDDEAEQAQQTPQRPVNQGVNNKQGKSLRK